MPRDTVTNTTFAERLAYARFVYHFRTGKMPGNAEIGRAAGRTGPWVTKWAESDTPPSDFNVHEPLAAFLGVDEDWLIKGRGKAPEADLWNRWIETRRTEHDPFSGDIEFPRSPLHREILEDEGEEAERPPSRRAAGESKKPKR